jgi:mRNA-degrading endonuclease toxin of MazEF toxin-antitoxin module
VRRIKILKLRDNTSLINSIKGKMASIVSEVLDIESRKADKFTDWLLSKSIYYRQHYNKERFSPVPPNMVRGNIVWVDFGINIGDEFSDDGTNGHFAMIWAQQGFMFIVIPLSKQPRNDNYTIDLGIISGLPYNSNSFAKLDNIKSIHIRRIRKINGQETGKIIYENKEKLNEIKTAIFSNFILDS